MKFWLLDPMKRVAAGPFDAAELRRAPEFGPESLVAPDGATDNHAWKPAREYPQLRAAPGGPPPLPVSQPHGAPSGPGDAGIMALAALFLAFVNVAWQGWLIFQTNKTPSSDLKNDMSIYGLLMFAPALAALLITSAARRRTIRTQSLGETGVLTVVAVTISWITFVVVGLWFSLLYAGSR